MHLLRSNAIGTEVIDEAEYQIHGKLTDLVIDPDRGKILALLLRSPFGTSLALQTQDILSWGKRIHIGGADVLAPPQEFVRLEPFLRGDRPMIRQRIRTKGGVFLGTCVDLQFSADHFEVEWIFPRRFLRKGIPLPASDIIEITEDAIIVKDQIPKEESIVAEEAPVAEKIDPLVTPAPGCTSFFSR